MRRLMDWLVSIDHMLIPIAIDYDRYFIGVAAYGGRGVSVSIDICRGLSDLRPAGEYPLPDLVRLFLHSGWIIV
jgi:hypothetical protein